VAVQVKHSSLKRYNNNQKQLAFEKVKTIISISMQIIAYTRSLGKIIKGCAATALAAQCYEGLDFDTAHSLFNIPVVEDEEGYDHIDEIFCDTSKYVIV